MSFDISRNTLVDETSPYLRQHADNPVHWQPWCDQALTWARVKDRPILLSIGYSACHWCHVMAHESFTDAATATLMNQLFVNIKVDREERPDLDKIYQSAHQLLMRRPGGWPLTVFLTPDDHVPFFVGTYFPPVAHQTMPSFRQLLVRVRKIYDDQREDIRTQNISVINALQSMEPEPGTEASLSAAPLKQAQQLLLQSFDSVHGGFGTAPKFPHSTNLERLLRNVALTGGDDKDTLKMIRFSFQCMYEGGLYDQLGGGFYRYSVDERWMIPHFEKMLYDNGLLLQLACQLSHLTPDNRLDRVIRETADWVIREMQAPEGGYWSTLDADSEGEEGKFYVWTATEIQQALTPTEWDLFAPRFGLDRSPNFEDRHWHLHGFKPLEQVAADHGVEPTAALAILDRARAKLFALRSQRVRPGLDHKVLTAWNALMIKAMAQAARAIDDPRYLQSAERAKSFIHHQLWHEQRLFAVYCEGKAGFSAYLDDYAFMIDAMLDLLECRFNADDLEFAIELADALLAHFEDRQRGGFFFTAHDHEHLLYRTKPMQDDALPSGNGIAAYALQRLGHLLGDRRYLEASKRTLLLAQSQIARAPHAHNALLLAQEEYLYPPQTIVLRANEAGLARWSRRAHYRYAPRRQVLAIPNRITTPLPGLLAERTPQSEDGTIAYVCQGHHCDLPITSFEAFEQALETTEIVLAS